MTTLQPFLHHLILLAHHLVSWRWSLVAFPLISVTLTGLLFLWSRFAFRRGKTFPEL